MVLGSHTGSQTLPGQAGLWSLSLAVLLGVRQPALTKTRNTDPYCWPVQNSVWLRPSARLSVSLAFYLFMGLFYVGRDVQEAFRSRVEPRLFIYFFLELEESHLLPASGLYSQSETEKQIPCLQKQHTGSSTDLHLF